MNRFYLKDPRLEPDTTMLIGYGQVTVPEAWVWLHPDHNSARQTQYTFGEPLRILAQQGDWLHAQSLRDDYCGWILEKQVQWCTQYPVQFSHSTRYAAPVTTAPSLKSAPVCLLPPDATFSPDDEQGEYLHLPQLGWLHNNHALTHNSTVHPVTTAREQLGKSYVWGGRSVAGLDCSALTQLCYRRAGYAIPRDADLQARYLAKQHQRVCLNQLQPADLIFIPGHVMLAVNQQTIIHASGHHMLVVEERLNDALSRYQSFVDSDEVSAYRFIGHDI